MCNLISVPELAAPLAPPLCWPPSAAAHWPRRASAQRPSTASPVETQKEHINNYLHIVGNICNFFFKCLNFSGKYFLVDYSSNKSCVVEPKLLFLRKLNF